VGIGGPGSGSRGGVGNTGGGCGFGPGAGGSDNVGIRDGAVGRLTVGARVVAFMPPATRARSGGLIRPVAVVPPAPSPSLCSR
jgi:hypothetical protein